MYKKILRVAYICLSLVAFSSELTVQIVATVDDECISNVDVINYYNILKDGRQGDSIPPLKNIWQQIAHQLISTKLQINAVKDQNIGLDNEFGKSQIKDSQLLNEYWNKIFGPEIIIDNKDISALLASEDFLQRAGHFYNFKTIIVEANSGVSGVELDAKDTGVTLWQNKNFIEIPKILRSYFLEPKIQQWLGPIARDDKELFLKIESINFPGRFQESEYLIYHILIPNHDPAGYDDLHQLSQSISGVDEFRKIAETYSQSQDSNRQGGSLGWIRMPEDRIISEVISNLNPGEISKPTETMNGWELFCLEDSRTKSFDDFLNNIAVNEIYLDKLSKKIDEITEVLFDRAQIKYFEVDNNIWT